MAIMSKLFNNTRKPQGILGKMMIMSMNRGHAAVSDWGLGCLPGSLMPLTIGDLGCGGGRNVQKLLQLYPRAEVWGLDYSEVSVESTRKRNALAIRSGRCQVEQGDVSRLSWEDNRFDLMTAFETVYFWPGPGESFRQVLRALKPGGTFLIVCESDGENPDDQKWTDIIEGVHFYSKEQLRAFLLEAGFSSVEIHHNITKHWLCILAGKAVETDG